MTNILDYRAFFIEIQKEVMYDRRILENLRRDYGEHWLKVTKAQIIRDKRMMYKTDFYKSE